MASNTQTRVDDTDTSSLDYAGNWFSSDVQVDDNTMTMHSTNASGANVTLSFSGTSIQALGESKNHKILITYTLDGASQSQQMEPTSVRGQPDTLLDMDMLDCSNHTVTIVNQPGQTLSIDSFIFTPCLPTALKGSSSLPDTSSPTPNIGLASPDGSSKKGINTGLVAGIVAAVVFFVILCFVISFFFLRRRGYRVFFWRRKRSAPPSAAYLASLSTRADALFAQPAQSSSGLPLKDGVVEKAGYNFAESPSPFSHEKSMPLRRSPSPVEYLPAYMPPAAV